MPMMNDVTTSFEKPPRYRDPKRDADYPAKFVAYQKQLHPDIAPLALSVPPAEAFRKVVEAAKKMEDWQITVEDAKALSLQAIAVTKLLRFRDDVAIEVRATGSSSCQVHMRSKSRLGRDDFGTNAKRIRTFFKLLK